MTRGPVRDGLAELESNAIHALPAHDGHYDVEEAVPCEARTRR
jgi:hypothetical protein